MPFKTRNVILFCWTQKFVLFSLSEIQFVIVGSGTRTRVINSSNSQWGSIIWVTQCTADTTAREGGGRRERILFPHQHTEAASQMFAISLVIGAMIENDVLKQEESY